MNKIIVSVFLAWFLCQGVLKTITRSIEKKKIYWKAILEGGGMPSGHAALVSGLSTAVGIISGFDSMLFFVTLTFSIFVIYETLITKNTLIQIIKIVSKHSPHEHLAEKIGHTLLEILVGIVIGSAVVYIGLVYF